MTVRGSRLHIDWETRSAADLKKVGAAKYFAHPSTEPTALSMRLDDEPEFLWWIGQPFVMPVDISKHIHGGGIVVAHHMGFDRQAWNRFVSYPKLKIEQTDCTMARGRNMSLPASLALLGEALRISAPKDLVGHRLMMKLCKPRSVAEDGTITWWEDPDDFERQAEYCSRDTAAETLIDTMLPPLTPLERKTWILDQKINERGVKVDVARCERAIAIAEEAKAGFNARIEHLTGGAVKKVTQVKKLVEWLNGRGIPCDSIGKGETEDLVLFAEIVNDDAAAAAVETRREAAKASVSKYAAMVAWAGADHRMRGALEYCATLTRRWGGRGPQVQNFKRNDPDTDGQAIADCLDALGADCSTHEALQRLELMTGDPMDALSKSLRAMIIADEGKILRGGDFTNVESRLAAWIAGADWKLNAFRAYDVGEGPDIYKVTAAGILGKAVDDVAKKERQEYGKVPELACGYQGGVGAFQKMAAGLGVRISDARAADIVQEWRAANPEIVDAWYALGEGAVEAVENPGKRISVLRGLVSYRCTSGFLFCQLPSGGLIAYPSPKLVWEQRKDRKTGEPLFREKEGGTREAIIDRKLKYWAEDERGKLAPMDLYGGAQFAHVVSGTARDLLVYSMHAAEARGYELVLTIHDELLCEVDKGFGADDELQEIMETKPAWVPAEVPIAASTWSGPRYAK